MKYSNLLHLCTSICLALTFQIQAQTNALPDIALAKGYGDAIPTKFWGSDSKAHLSAAIHLSAEQLCGASISAVQFSMALQPGSIDGQIFIKKTLEREENLYEQPFDAIDGQNIIWLDFPFPTSELDDLYIGYELTGRGNTIGYSYSDNVSPDGDYIRTGTGDWTHLSSVTGHNSALSLAAILTDREFPDELQHGIHLKQPQFYNISTAGEEYNLTVALTNTGIKTIHSFSISVENGDVTHLYNFEQSLINNQVAVLSIPYTPVSGEQTVSVQAQDAAGSLSIRQFETNGYDKTFPKLPLVEIFTSQKCSNCPAGESVLEKAIGNYSGEVIMVAHHAGFTADHFTIPESETFAEMIGANSAPLMSLDRKRGVTTSSTSTVFHPAYATEQLFDPYYLTNTLTGISVLKSEFNTPDSRMTVEIKAECDPSADTDSKIRLHAFAVEDKIIDTQNDLGTTHKEWEHNHVIRSFLTPIEGIEVDLDDPASNIVCLTATVKEIEGSHSAPVTPDNIHLITFLTGENGEVLNSSTAPVSLTSYASVSDISLSTTWLSIEGNKVSVTQSATVYDLSGRIVNILPQSTPTELPSGCYIIASLGSMPQKLFIR